MDINEAIEKITMAGKGNSKIEFSNNSYMIKVLIGGVWVPVLTGVTKEIAENIISKAENRIILG